jgi:hypothetical protein
MRLLVLMTLSTRNSTNQRQFRRENTIIINVTYDCLPFLRTSMSLYNRKSVTTLFSWMNVFIFLTVSILLITLFRCCCCLQTDSDKNLRSSMIASEHVSFRGIRNLKFPLLPFQARVGGTGYGLNLSSSNWRTTEEWSPRRSRAFSSATGLPLVG